MRFLMKIPMPSAAENPVVAEAGFDEKLRNLFAQVGGEAAYSTIQEGHRVYWVPIDIKDAKLMTPTAEFIFQFLKVKTEFLPEVTPKPYYGRLGY